MSDIRLTIDNSERTTAEKCERDANEQWYDQMNKLRGRHFALAQAILNGCSSPLLDESCAEGFKEINGLFIDARKLQKEAAIIIDQMSVSIQHPKQLQKNIEEFCNIRVDSLANYQSGLRGFLGNDLKSMPKPIAVAGASNTGSVAGHVPTASNTPDETANSSINHAIRIIEGASYVYPAATQERLAAMISRVGIEIPPGHGATTAIGSADSSSEHLSVLDDNGSDDDDIELNEHVQVFG